jgi:hypothetical protein
VSLPKLSQNQFIQLASYCLAAPVKQYFMEPIYVVSLFLWPMYSKFCISKQYTLDWMIREILTLAISWGFKKYDRIAMKQGLVEYNSHIHELIKEKDPITFSLTTSRYPAALRNFLVNLYKLSTRRNVIFRNVILQIKI